MNKLVKKSLAFLGGSVMLVNLILPSLEVYADNDVLVVYNTCEPEAQGCLTLESALDSISDSDETIIELGEDIEISQNFSTDKSFTLDLNGHNIIGGEIGEERHSYIEFHGNVLLKGTNGGEINVRFVDAYGKFIIESGIINAVDSNGGAAVWVEPDGELTIEGGTLNGNKRQGIVNEGTVKINGGEINASENAAISNKGILTISNGNIYTEKDGSYGIVNLGKLTIVDGKISATKNLLEQDGNKIGGSAIYNGELSECNIEGGELEGFYGITLWGNGTEDNIKLNISGGKIKGKDFAVSGNGTKNSTTNYGGTLINISGGELECEGDDGACTTIYHPQDGKINITDGIYKGENSALEIRSGIVTISGGEFVATVTPASSEGNGNGTTTKGAAIGIAQHTTKQKISVTIEGGIFDGYAAVYQSDPNNTSSSRDESNSVITTINGGTFKGLVVDKNPGDFETLAINGGTFTSDPTEYVESSMVGQSETEYVVGTTEELKEVQSDANYVANPVTEIAFGDNDFDSNTTLSSSTIEIVVNENTGSAVNEIPATVDMKVSDGNTPTVEGQVYLTFSGHENETAKFKNPILIRIPITSSKTTARVMVKHAGDSNFNYKGLTTNSSAACVDGGVTDSDKYQGEPIPVVNGYALINTCSASNFVAYTETVKASPSSSTGRSGGSSSASTKKEETKVTTGNNEEITLGGEVTEESTTTGEVNNNEETKADVIISDAAKAKYDEEQLEAYKWAYENGITTINDVEKARLSDPLTRAELAKMMSQYISSVLKKSPIKTDIPPYKDVDESLGDLADYIVKAYQYQIMGINADGTALEYFNPNGLVSRAEFATVFSRVLFGDKYNQSEGNYYEKHIAALKEAGILSNDNPTIEEVRGWVMLMMYRSTKDTKATEENVSAEEAQAETGATADEGTGANVGIANPASTYCVEQGGEVAIKTDKDGGQYGMCKLSDGSEVEEWEYFRANHKDETSTGAVASTGDVAEVTTGATAEASTGSTNN